MTRLRTVLMHGPSALTYPEMERANAEAWLRKNGLPPGWEKHWQPTDEELARLREEMGQA